MSPQRHQYQFWADFEDIEKFKKLGTLFDTKLNQIIVKYMFLSSGSYIIIPLRFFAFDTLPMSPQQYQYQFWIHFKNA